MGILAQAGRFLNYCPVLKQMSDYVSPLVKCLNLCMLLDADMQFYNVTGITPKIIFAT